jgi:hypothetical protein
MTMNELEKELILANIIEEEQNKQELSRLKNEVQRGKGV